MLDLNPNKMTNLEAASVGIMNAIRTNCPVATDSIVALLDRRTGEFKFAAHPADMDRTINMVEALLQRLKTQRAKSGELK